MPQKIIIAEQERIAALLSDGRVDKLIVAQGRYQIGDIYLGTIENVNRGINAAFVNIGPSEKNGFLNANDLGPIRSTQTPAIINELVRPNQSVLVQVMKEPRDNKGPTLTGNISLPGRYIVLQPNGQGVTVSRQINTETERNRLKALGVLIKPPGTGIRIRSEAEKVSEELIINDLENLLKRWESILEKRDRVNPPTLLSRDQDFIHRVLRDHINSELAEVIVETSEASERAKRFLEPNNTNVSVDYLKQSGSLLENYKIDLAIVNALKPRVDLPSGGYIIIEPTEALTVIDVNSGSFASSNSSETVLWTNCEASIEIARQLKLRNIGGIIIVDFIDMESRRDQLQLLEYFTSALRNDSQRPQIHTLTERGLLELTRTRKGQSIYELFSKDCPSCNALGHIANITHNHNNEVQSSNFISGSIKTNFAIQNDLAANQKSTEKIIESNEYINDDDNINKNVIKERSSEHSNIKDLQENITVEMSEEEEYVYSNLGLSPTLLLEEKPKTENFTIKVLRTGIVNNDSYDQSSSNEKDKESKISSEKSSKPIHPTDPEKIDISEPKAIDDSAQISEKLLNEENNNESQKIELTDLDSSTSEEGNHSNQLEKEVEDPRRRRRRSSAVT